MARKRVAVIAATGKLGRIVVRRLAERETGIVAIGRDPAKLALFPDGVETRIADLTKPDTIVAALAGAALIASCAPASYVPAILSGLPDGAERLVAMGSSRRFSAWPDATALAAIRAETLLAKAAVPNVLLLSSTIYGQGGSTLDHWARLVKTWPLLFVPGGESARLQPIYIEDVADSIIAALMNEGATGAPIVIAGGEALTQRVLIRRIARRLGRNIVLVPLPGRAVRVAAPVAKLVPAFSGVAASILRLFEDRSFDVTAMKERLGVSPRPLDLSGLS